jgi:hypothetical protein
LRPGEGIEVGPFGLDWLDLDPRLIEPGEVYSVEVEYAPETGEKPRRVQQDVVLIASKTLDFPGSSPLDRAPTIRAPAKVKILDASGGTVRDFYWSPDMGLAPPPESTTEL